MPVNAVDAFFAQVAVVLRAALEEARHRFPEPPTRSTPQLQITNGSVSSATFSQSIDWGYVTAEVSEALQETEKFVHLVDATLRDPILSGVFLIDAGGQPVPEEAAGSGFSSMILMLILYRYLDDTGSYEWNADEWETIESDLREYLNNETFPVEIVVPLLDFYTEAPMTVTDSVELRAITDEEKAEVYKSLGGAPGVLPHHHILQALSASHAAVFREERTRSSAFGIGPLLPEITDLLTAIRITLPGHPAAWINWVKTLRWVPEHVGGVGAPGFLPHLRHQVSHLKYSHQDQLRHVYERHRDALTSLTINWLYGDSTARIRERRRTTN